MLQFLLHLNLKEQVNILDEKININHVCVLSTNESWHGLPNLTHRLEAKGSSYSGSV